MQSFIILFVSFLTMSVNASSPSFFEEISVEMAENEFYGQGVLYYKEKKEVLSSRDYNYCNWFLISKNEAVTNSHCVQHSLYLNLGSCTDNIAGVFKTRSGVVKRKCKKIRYSTKKESIYDADIAIIELDEDVHDINPLEIRSSGPILRKTKIKIPTFNISRKDKIIKAIPRTLECRAYTDPEISSFYHNELSTVFLFDESKESCSIIGGNSGSPMFSGEKVVGAAHAKIRHGSFRNIVEYKRRRGLSVGTSFHCEPHLGGQECSNSYKEESLSFIEKLRSDEIEAIKESLMSYNIWKLLKPFSYDFLVEELIIYGSKDTNYKVKPDIKCVYKDRLNDRNDIKIPILIVSPFVELPYLYSNISSVEKSRKHITYSLLDIDEKGIELKLIEETDRYFPDEKNFFVPWCNDLKGRG